MTDTAALLLIILLSLTTGIVSKISDLFNDDGLRSFTGASELSGIVWAITGSALVFLDNGVAALWLATVLYWFLRRKLDHFNHAFAGVCISGCGILAATHGRVDSTGFLFLLAWLVASGYANTWLKQKYVSHIRLQKFLRLRLRYYAGPIILSIFTTDPMPAASILAGMLGTEAVTILWNRNAPLIESSAVDHSTSELVREQ
ncbi:hypothetical protein ACWY4P_52425 [Streptomyces sp. LZ34]